MKEEYGAKNPRSMWLRMIAGGGGNGLYAEQPEVNIMRGAYYALIGALGGAQTMALCCYDEAYTIPSEFAQRLSLRTMQLLVEESGLCDTVDPLAGSYYVETLTNQMRERMEQIIAEVDAQGGIVKQVSEGGVQSKVSARAYNTQSKILSGEIRKVGVNCYQMEEEEEHEPQYHPYDEAAAQKQIDATNAIKAKRDQAEVERTLSKVKDDAESGANVMPAIMEAVKAYATVGEITSKLTEAYGHYQEPIRF